MNVGPESVLAGFYVYGALCYALIGGAAIAWHDRTAFVLVLVGAVLTSISYLLQVEITAERRSLAKIFVVLGWCWPAIAAVQLVLWS